MRKIINIFVLYFSIAMIGMPLHAQNNDTKKENEKSVLLYLTPPILGYSSITGTRWNFTPIGVEIPISKLMGVRFEPDLFANSTRLLDFSLAIIFPVYFNRNRNNDIYCGFYIGPFILPTVTFYNTVFHFGAGGMIGYAWNLDSYWHFNVGFGIGYDVMMGYMTGKVALNIGYWL